jgi:hypothetical protein
MTYRNMRRLSWTLIGLQLALWLTGCATYPTPAPIQVETWYQERQRHREAYLEHVVSYADELIQDEQDFRNKRGQYAPN